MAPALCWWDKDIHTRTPDPVAQWNKTLSLSKPSKCLKLDQEYIKLTVTSFAGIPVNRSAATFVVASSPATPVCGHIRNCTAGKRTISAPFADWPLPRLFIWRIMREFIRAKSLTSTSWMFDDCSEKEFGLFFNCFLFLHFRLAGARRVACSFHSRHILRTMNARIAENVRMCAAYATRDLPVMRRCGIIAVSIPARSHTNAKYAARHFHRQRT